MGEMAQLLYRGEFLGRDSEEPAGQGDRELAGNHVHEIEWFAVGHLRQHLRHDLGDDVALGPDGTWRERRHEQ